MLYDDFFQGAGLPKFRWWRLEDWRHRAAMRGFDDGTLHQLDGYGNCFNPPRLFFRQAYIDEFWEGASK